MDEHTPGPWHASSYDGWDCIRDAHDQIIAKLALNVPDNARLIAAAPELLAVLDETVSRFERCIVHAGSDPEFAREAVKAARAVIAKARGDDDPMRAGT